MDFLLLNGGYLGIILFLVLTGCGLPIPEEVPIVLAGVYSAQGSLQPELAFAACLFGALLGDSVMYAVGYHFGHGLLSKHPHIGKFLGAEREEYFEKAIKRHGFKVMLLARFMVGVRGPVYLAAGVVRMPYRRFVIWDLICATLVVGTFFGLSFSYGQQITQVLRDAELTLTLVVLLIAGIMTLWWLRRRRLQLIDEAIDSHAEDGPLATDRSEPRSTEEHQEAKDNSTPNEEVA